MPRQKTPGKQAAAAQEAPDAISLLKADHTAVKEILKIPMIDIVETKPTASLFGDYHHTVRDNLDVIDRNVLKAVGQTVTQVIYQEE